MAPHPIIRIGASSRALAASALLACAAPAWSMDLLQAFEAARTQDASILASRAAAAAGRERLPQARAQLLPNISASATRNRNQLSSTTPNFFGEEQTTHSHYPSSSDSLSLRQPLIRGYQVAQYRQAQAQVQDSEAALAQDEQNLAVRVSGAYFEAVLSYEQLALVQVQKASTATQLDVARKTFAAGSGTRTDIDEAQARLDMTLALEIEARQNVDYTMRQLQTLTNQPADQPIERLAAIDVARFELVDPQPNRLEDWTLRAEQNSPQMQSLRAQVAAAQLEIDKARSGHLPTLDAVLQWSSSSSESVTNLKSRYNSAAIGLQLNVPLYSGGGVDSGVRQALASRDRAEQALEAGRRDLGLRVHKEFRGMTEGVPKVRALEQAQRSAEQLVLSSRRSLQAGSRTVVDVLNAEQQRMVAMRDLAQARYVYLVSRIRLLALVGAADAEAIAAVNQMLQR